MSSSRGDEKQADQFDYNYGFDHSRISGKKADKDAQIETLITKGRPTPFGNPSLKARSTTNAWKQVVKLSSNNKRTALELKGLVFDKHYREHPNRHLSCVHCNYIRREWTKPRRSSSRIQDLCLAKQHVSVYETFLKGFLDLALCQPDDGRDQKRENRLS